MDTYLNVVLNAVTAHFIDWTTERVELETKQIEESHRKKHRCMFHGSICFICLHFSSLLFKTSPNNHFIIMHIY